MGGAFAGGAFGTEPFGGSLAAGDMPVASDTFPTLRLRYSLTGPLSDPNWVTVDGCIRSVHVVRGRDEETPGWGPGTCEIVLRNAEREFDPENPGSPHAGYLTTNRRIRVEATFNGLTYPLFDGFADRWEQVPGDGYANNYAECNLVATDIVKLASKIRLEATNALILDDPAHGLLDTALLAGPYEFGIEQASGRALTILRSSAIPETCWFVDSAPTVLVADQPDPAGDIWTYLERVAASIGGDLVTTADGRLALWDRWRWSRVPAAGVSTGTWSDTPAAIDGYQYQSVDMLAADERSVANIVIRSRGQFTASKRDAASIDLYGPIEDSRDDLLTWDRNEIVAQCEYLLARSVDPRARVGEMVIVPQRDPATMFPQVLGRELGDRFTISRTLAGVGAPFVAELQLDHVEHTVTPGVWRTVWAATLAASTDRFVLDDSLLDNDATPLAY